MSPRPYAALGTFQTPHGLVIVRSVYAQKQKQYILVFDGPQAAVKLVLPGWRPRSAKSCRTQLTPPISISSQTGISTFFEQIAPKLRARLAGGDAYAVTGTSPPPPTYRTLGEVAALVQSEGASAVRATSAATYRAQWTRLLQLLPPSTLLSELTHVRLQKLVAHLIENGTAATTLRNLAVTLNKGLARAVSDGVLKQNPLDALRLPKAVRRPRHPINKAQRERLLTVAREHGRDMTFVCLLGAYAGLRRGEILSLRWEDVDLVHRVLRVQRSEVFEPKTGDRTVPICSVLHETLMRYKRAAGYIVRPRATTAGPHRYVFRRLLRTVAVNAKLPWMTCHDLRRAFATCAAEDGVDAFRLRRWLGHASITQTSDYVLDGGEYDDAIEGRQLGEPRAGWVSVGPSPMRVRECA